MVLPAGARECVCRTGLLIKRRNYDFQTGRGLGTMSALSKGLLHRRNTRRRLIIVG